MIAACGVVKIVWVRASRSGRSFFICIYFSYVSICIAIINEDPIALANFDDKGQSAYVPTIAVAELYAGVRRSQRIAANLAKLERFLALVPIVPFNLSAAKEFGLIEGELKRLGKPTGKQDAMIAAIARNLGAIVVTHNRRHFENIPHLQIEDWLIP
ncbi:type II toxin-antitoxin system VapC family toxin [Trichothermofontia sichuanensis B231]|uniref:type II toxin-antitoxin system VapC family toxin n=1 Tax=Trichothermofontia sichuanensis TaxID=3045816 RepID=UPI0022459078|nr:type II toxin-antitoxin system VapC family toxin [Trichothermofontia sichuanensis]UZQ54741.1 type II toxin-antitoxin system VapC family toxin [Trichothermofontia sichuanensis B231]